LDDIGAEVGKLQREHVARDQPRQIEDADAVERAGRCRVELDWECVVHRPSSMATNIAKPFWRAWVDVGWVRAVRGNAPTTPLRWRVTHRKRTRSRADAPPRSGGLRVRRSDAVER